MATAISTPTPAISGENTGSFLVSRRHVDDTSFSVPGSLNLIWAPEGGAIRIGAGNWNRIGTSDYVISSPGALIELRPPRHEQGRIDILGVSPAMVRDISEELRNVSRAGLCSSTSSAGIVSMMPGGVLPQPNWLRALLQDLDQAASLGLQDTGWLLRHVRLVWERLIFSCSMSETKRQNRPARARRSGGSGLLSRRLVKVKQMMEEHYDQSISLDEMAASACVSRYHFLREFRKNFGKTPYQLLLNIRLDAARRMLESESTPVNEISRKVGFSSPDGFYRAFRKRFRRSPSEYRTAA